MLCLLHNTKTCRPIYQLEMICALVRWILRYLLLITSARLSSITNPVSASSVRESDLQTGRIFFNTWFDTDFTTRIDRSQGELARSSLENADTVIARRRIVGKRTTISPAPLVLSDTVDSASVPESLNEAGLPEVLEPSEGDTKKRRVESCD